MNTLDIKKLPFFAKASICWGFFWRGIVVSLASGVCAGLLGAIIGFVFVLAGVPKATMGVGVLLGTLCGFLFLYILVRWLLTSRIGRFRLVLVSASETI